MAFELPQHIKDLAIPEGNDARGGLSMLGNNFSDAVDDKNMGGQSKADYIAARDESIQYLNSMDDNPDSVGKAIRDTGASGSRIAAILQKEGEKRNEKTRDLQMLLANIADFEGGLEAQYGENFDLDLLGDLVEQGKFTQEEYEKFASIEDKDERRKAIAVAIQDKIDAGEIDPADLQNHSWANKWLGMHEEVRIEQNAAAKLSVENNELSQEAAVQAGVRREVKSLTNSEQLLVEAKAAQSNANDTVEQAQSGFVLSLPTIGG